MSVTQQVPYEARGRSSQKHRTRDALVAAARRLVARGITPTVDEAAESASISRTTAYRYFPTRAALLAAAHPETALTTVLPRNPPADVAKRLQIVVRRFHQTLSETEEQQRTMLRLSLDPRQDASKLPLRQGRAIPWIEEALAPLRDRLGDAAVRRLALAIRSVIGIESLVWLVDVGGLSRSEALKTMRASADALLLAAMR